MQFTFAFRDLSSIFWQSIDKNQGFIASLCNNKDSLKKVTKFRFPEGENFSKSYAHLKTVKAPYYCEQLQKNFYCWNKISKISFCPCNIVSINVN